MKKSLLLATIATLGIFTTHAQVTNRAIEFESTGTVDCGQLPTLRGYTSFTIQFYINPNAWTPGATILSRGDDFSAKLGNEKEIVFTVGNTSLTATSEALGTGEWTSVMLVCSNKQAEAFVNGESAGKGTLTNVPASEENLILGGGYAGQLDEVRIWNAALDSEYEYFLYNTLNKWAPQWDNLLVYYKMDQADSCPNLIDYKVLENPAATFNNHGIFKGGVKRVDANNPKMPYLWNAAYTENVRFYDRLIPREQYLLSNAIIILGSDIIPDTGGIKTRTPNYHAVSFNNANYMAEYQGRQGVVALNGNGYVECPTGTFTNYAGNALSTYTFETWVYLEEWTEGAYLVRKENDAKTEGIAAYLGNPDEKRLVIRINGKEYVTLPTELTVGEWHHVAFTPGSTTLLVNTLYVYVDGTKPSYCIDPTLSATTMAETPAVSNQINCYLGEGLKGKLDETCIWQKTFPGSDIKAQMTTIPVPSFTKNVLQVDMENVNTYYKYDNPDWLGFSTHSQDSWMYIMKSAFDGRGGAKMYISVNGKYAERSQWVKVCNQPALRSAFAKACAELSQLYDGVELDLEWIEGTKWTNYALMADEIIAALPEGKEFRVSTHNNYYKLYPVDQITTPGLTGFTIQQYGPQADHFGYQNFVNNTNGMLDYGYPKDEIVTSYSTTTSNNSAGGQPTGIRTLMPTYVPQPNANIERQNGFSFMGPYQVYKRAKYTRDLDLQGIFYWDMGNDYWEGTPANPVMPKYNYAKYCSYGINSNVDSIITQVDVMHYDPAGIESVKVENPKEVSVLVTPSPATDSAEVTVGGEAATELTVYSLGGSAVIRQEGDNVINVADLQAGVYLIAADTATGRNFRGKFTVRH